MWMPGVLAAKQATTTISIVISPIGDAVTAARHAPEALLHLIPFSVQAG
jgi:hypothetical protein